jgi:hypothetical protein
MRNLDTLNNFRLRTPAILTRHGTYGDHTCGVFKMRRTILSDGLLIIASVGDGWDHVSVSGDGGTPEWADMEFVKRKFFEDHETAMQLHVPPSEHINCHPFCLHLWRPLDVEIPRPPSIMVGR